MLQALKNDFRISGKDNWIFASFLGGGFVFGQLMLFVVLRIAGEEGWFPMGTLMGGLFAVIAVIICDGVGFKQRYMLALSMGRTRKPLIAAQFAQSLLRALLVLLCVWPLGRLDVALYRVLYYANGADDEIAAFVLEYVTPQHLLAAALPVAVLAFFLAAIYGRFGKKGGGVLYFVFLGCCIGFPRIIDRMERYPGSTAGRILAALSALPPAFWILFAVALVLLLLLIALRLLLRMQVNLE